MGKLAMVYGPGGSGKSFVMLDMALCVAAGIPWHGKDVNQGKILFIAGEGASGLPSRIESWCAGNSIRLDDINHMVDIIDGPVDIFNSGVASQDLIDLCGMVRTDKYLMVIFDTYNRCTPGLEENSAKDTSMVLRNLTLVQNAGATVVLIHHTPKDGSSPRGSAALEWATDHGIKVEKKGSNVVVTNARQKDHESGEKIYLSLVSEPTHGSAYLVDSDETSYRDDGSDTTHGVAGIPEEFAFNPFDTDGLGAEVTDYAGKGAALVRPMAQLMAQRASRGGVGVSRAEAMRLLGRSVKDGSARSAWDFLWRIGAIEPVNSGSRSTTTAMRWVEPERRQDVLDTRPVS